MISKELLSEILHENRVTIKNLCISNNILIYVSFCSPNELNGTNYNEHLLNDYHCLKADIYQEINIYELAHKCKEWAIKKGYQFKVYYQADGTEEWEIGLAGYGWDLFRAKNCVETCQWILENK